MSDYGFTPGPWEVSKGCNQYVAAGGHWVAASMGIRGDEGAANARLIAASPTLLEALEELEQRADEVVAALDKYNAENGTHLGGPPFFKIGVALAKARAAITLATGEPK